MGNDKAGTMKRIIGGLWMFFLTTALLATSCKEYGDAYAMAQYKMNEIGIDSNRERYDLVNGLIDSAVAYLAYCSKKISLADQYQILQVLKREDKNRREYFSGAVREYHAIYDIRPNVTEIYQGENYQDDDGESSFPSSPPRFPPVQQPMMPPVQH
jgi:hypothetical protein